MTFQAEFLTENERKIIDFLREGSKQRREIIKHFGEEKKRTANNVLNKLEKEEKIFRIKKDDNVFYKLNEFTLGDKMLLAAFNLIIGSGSLDDDSKSIFKEIKEDFIKFYPKLTPSQVLSLWEVQLTELSKGHKDVNDLMQKFKKSLE